MLLYLYYENSNHTPRDADEGGIYDTEDSLAVESTLVPMASKTTYPQGNTYTGSGVSDAIRAEI